MQKKIPNEQNVQITVQILSVPLVQLFFFFCAVQVYLSLTLKQNFTRNLTFSVT